MRRDWRELKEAFVCELTTITNIAEEKPSIPSTTNWIEWLEELVAKCKKQNKLHIYAGNRIMETVNMKMRTG